MAETQGQEEYDEAAVERARAFVDGRVKEQVQAALAEMRASEASRQPAPQPAGAGQSNDDAMRSLLDPYIKPDVNQARMEAMSAADEARFYRRHAEASDHEEQIESIFIQMMKDGRPMKRDDIYRYLIGKMAVDEPDKFSERQEAKRKAQVERAESAVDIGFSSRGREKETQTFRNFDQLTTEEMEKALEGVTF